jgi:hypothetical protein
MAEQINSLQKAPPKLAGPRFPLKAPSKFSLRKPTRGGGGVQ